MNALKGHFFLQICNSLFRNETVIKQKNHRCDSGYFSLTSMRLNDEEMETFLLCLRYFFREKECHKLSSDLTNLQSEVNIIKDLNMNANVSHQIYPIPDYFTSFLVLTIVSFVSWSWATLRETSETKLILAWQMLCSLEIYQEETAGSSCQTCI